MVENSNESDDPFGSWGLNVRVQGVMEGDFTVGMENFV